VSANQKAGQKTVGVIFAWARNAVAAAVASTLFYFSVCEARWQSFSGMQNVRRRKQFFPDFAPPFVEQVSNLLARWRTTQERKTKKQTTNGTNRTNKVAHSESS
jgi:hypothetical protein